MTRVAVVTGSNKGIGFAIVKALCEQFDGSVYLTSRDVGRGKKAVADLEKLGLKPKYHPLDIDEEETITALREHLLQNYGGLDILVNNAAISFRKDASEALGLQARETLRVNFFGTLKVCEVLFPILRPHARVVNLSSSAGFLGRIPGEELRKKLGNPDLTREELVELMNDFVDSSQNGSHVAKGWPETSEAHVTPSAYAVSKVGVSVLSRIQQCEFDADSREDLIVNHVHPGYVKTDMTAHTGPMTVEEGAVASVYAALLPPNVSSPRGDYIWNDKQIVDWLRGPLPSKN